MSDLSAVAPTFPFAEYDGAIQAFEKAALTTSDLVSLDVISIAQRTGLPSAAVESVRLRVIECLHSSVLSQDESQSSGRLQEDGVSPVEQAPLRIPLLDHDLNRAIAGGFPTGVVAEVVGPSGAGKTQFVLGLLLSSQLSRPVSLHRASCYVSTEHPLPTNRLKEILSSNSVLSAANPRPSLDNVITFHAPDLETQNHVLEFQLPIVLERRSVGLVVIDSIAANYRAETTRWQQEARGSQARGLHNRTSDLVQLGALLRNLARKHDCAIVVTNQVADRVDTVAVTMHDAGSSPSPSPASQLDLLSMSQPELLSDTDSQQQNGFHDALLSLDHQQRFFSGWGDRRPNYGASDSAAALQTPTLGLVWANQIACRIALHKTPDRVRNATTANGQASATELVETVAGLGGVNWAPMRWRRRMRVVFSFWCRSCGEDDAGLEYEIYAGGLRSVETLVA